MLTLIFLIGAAYGFVLFVNDIIALVKRSRNGKVE